MCLYFHMLTNPYWPAGPGEGHTEGHRQKSGRKVYIACSVSWVNLSLRHCRGSNNCGDCPGPKTNKKGIKHILSALNEQKQRQMTASTHTASHLLLNVAPQLISKIWLLACINILHKLSVFLIQKKLHWKQQQKEKCSCQSETYILRIQIKIW